MFLRHKDFKKQYKKLNIDLKEKVVQKLTLFSKESNAPSLHNHALQGKWKGHRSINITGDLRAIYRKENETIIFVAIGSHADLYQ